MSFSITELEVVEAVNQTLTEINKLYSRPGVGNLAFGENSLISNTTDGNYNTAFGNYSLKSNIDGIQNTAFGFDSLSSNTNGVLNTAFGTASLNANINGFNNTAFGNVSLYKNTTGDRNVAFGATTLISNIDGSRNSAFGDNSLRENINGSQNTAVGSNSLRINNGSNNTALGQSAGISLNNGNVTCIGYNSQPSTSSVSDEITLGNNQIQKLRCNVTSITSLSDKRDKTEIRELESTLDIISKLKPVTFKWDRREWYENEISDGSKKNDVLNIGFIAQDLKELQEENNINYFNLVNESNPEKLETTPGNLLIPLIKAVQELKIIIDKQQEEIQLLKKKYF
jgi:regulator of RNase E activity RraB